MNENQKTITLKQKAKESLKNKDYLAAHKALLNILQIDQEYSDAFYLLAIIPLESGNTDKAIELLNRAIALASQKVKYHVTLAKCFALKGDVIRTVESVEHAVGLGIENPIDFDTLGVAFSRIGLHEKALAFFKKAISENTGLANTYFNLGSCYKFLGFFSEAKNAYKKTLSMEPNHVKALASCVALGKLKDKSDYIKRLESLIETTKNSDDILQLSHALASIFESQNKYSSAFKILEKAKQKKICDLGYVFAEDKKMFDSLHKIFSDKNIDYHPGYRNDEAIFVVGMPRTGTTLVERMLSNHSDVSSVGELHNFEVLLKQMTNVSSQKLNIDSELLLATEIDFETLGKKYIESVQPLLGNGGRFVDKLPLNILFVGFIVKALPNCKIICLDRNPLDTVVSNYRQIFSPKYAYCNYTNSLESITEFYLSYKALALFWHNLFPTNVCMVNYEELVSNPKKKAEDFMLFCDLTWQPGCLNIEDNKSPVATASATQVRQPVQTKYIGTWCKYEEYLVEVKKKLAHAGAI